MGNTTKKMGDAEVIDCTPTWEGLLPVYLNTVHAQSSRTELQRMAKFADEYNTFIRSLDKEDHALMDIISKLNTNEKKHLLAYARTIRPA